MDSRSSIIRRKYRPFISGHKVLTLRLYFYIKAFWTEKYQV